MARNSDEGHKLFVGRLPTDCTEDEVRFVFVTYGEVNGVILLKPHEGTGHRSAFVFYKDRTAGDDAIKVLDNQYKIRHDAEHSLAVRWARKSGDPPPQEDGEAVNSADGYKLFVGGLPSDVREEELRTVFGTYGEVSLVHCMPPSNQSGNAAAFVFYQRKESAEDAIKLLDGQYKIRHDADQCISVRWGRDKRSKGGGKGDHGSSNYDSGRGGGGYSSWGGSSNSWNSSSGGYNSGGGGRDGGYNSGGGGGYNSGGGGGYNSGGGGGGGGYNSGGGGGGGGYNSYYQQNQQQYGQPQSHEQPAVQQQASSSEPTVLVGGLPYDITQEEVNTVFSTYGEVVKIQLSEPNPADQSVSGHVFYRSAEAAEDAVKLLDGVYKIREDALAPLSVKRASGKDAAQGDWSGGSQASSGYGAAGGCSAQGDTGGYGGGVAAPLGGYGAGGGQTDYSSQGGSSGGGYAGGGGSGGAGGGYGGGGGGGGGYSKDYGSGGDRPKNRLFVGNLPSDITEDALQYVFGVYGQVDNIHVMAGKSKSGQSCAFVNYKDAQEAETAVMTLHEKYEIRPGQGAIVVQVARSQSGRSSPYSS